MDDNGTCRVDAAIGQRPGLFAGRPCGEPVAAVIEFGCLHEHVDREAVCAAHRDRVLGGTARCARCWEGPPVSRNEPHVCALLGRVVTAV